MNEIENELVQMSNDERLLIIEIAIKLVRKSLTKETLKKKLSLKESAELLYKDYLYDEELTLMTRTLEGEDFYDEY